MIAHVTGTVAALAGRAQPRPDPPGPGGTAGTALAPGGAR